MTGNVESLKEIKEISACLSVENKKYVIAVANALLFSQRSAEHEAEQTKPRTRERELIHQ